MATDKPMSDEDMRKELQNIHMQMNATTDEVSHTYTLYMGFIVRICLQQRCNVFWFSLSAYISKEHCRCQ